MNKSTIILLAIILVLVLAITFGIAWLVLSGGQDKEVAEKPKYDLKKAKMYSVAGEPIVSNLNTGDIKDKKVIRIRVQLLVADDKMVTELTNFNGKLRDNIISILKSKTPEEMIKPDAQEVVKKEIIQSFNSIFNTDKVLDVYFEEFIVQ
ncbi:flagellar basal body-associated FliL family protein [Petroclostridium sp. X23]|uniref:flagellar basal body-associated FliL family protein n=1 Tax=Petroclostridium sp. X23 TaxID=3045146 RepID=UPI0024ACD9FF|nr:flagellar basal body-associated FliL family protein [Petroclostridium sp. X23]WHH58943.1 flagellar basal body-associated FliL family protein [Petroclostridium sp. X23]